MRLPITTLYVLPLIIIWAVLWVRVVMARVQTRTSLGEGGSVVVLEAVRRHGNFIEWVPLLLVLMLLAEIQGASSTMLHIAGLLIVGGRLAHPFGLAAANGDLPLRKVGNSLNMFAMLMLTGLLARIAFSI